MKKNLTIFVLFAALSSTMFAEDKPKGKIHGYTFGDYYFMVNNNNSDLENQNGFWFRRIYLGYDYQISDAFSSRVRFEMAQDNGFDGEAEKMGAVIKDVYLKWKTGKQSVIVGMSSTPTWGIVEKVWGYRSVEKTPLDMQKLASSRDMGIAAKGQFDEDGLVKYHVMFGNGSSNKNETFRGKSIMGALSVHPIKGLVIEGYFDHADTKQGQTTSTLQGFAAYQTDDFRFGVQFAQQTLSMETGEGDNTDDQIVGLISTFAVAKISEHFNVFARVDKLLDASPYGYKNAYLPFAPNAKSTFLVAGIDYSPVKNVKIMPNIEMVSYDDIDGVAVESDLMARVTFFYAFK